MTPDFALHLSPDGISLDHRGQTGWVRLGTVTFGSDAFAGEMAALKAKGRAAAGEDFRVKLVLPNDQIKTIELRDDTATAASVAMALEGATPYALSDLAYDWYVAAGRTQIAAVARETLEEAEGFAREYRFEPAAFCALPDRGWDGTEAFFGPAEGSNDAARDPAPYVATTPEAAAEAEAAHAAQQAVEQTPPATASAPATEPPLSDPPVTDASDDTAPPNPAPAAEPAVAQPAHGAEDNAGDDHVAEPDDGAIAAGFASVRLPEPGAAPTLGAATPSPGAAAPVSAPPRVALTPGADGAAPTGRAPAVASPTTIPTAPPVAAPTRDASPDAMAAAQSLRPGAADFAEPEPTPPADDATATGLGGMFRSRRKPARATVTEVAPAPGSGSGAPDGLTDLDRKAAKARVGGKPRFLGLILTVVLILLLLAVAAFATVRTEGGLARLWTRPAPQAAEGPQIAPSVAPEALGVPRSALAPGPETVALAPVMAATPEEIEDAGEEIDTTTLAGEPQPDPADPPLSDAEIARLYAATGLWLRAPDAPAALSPSEITSLYVASIDGVISGGDAVALRADNRADLRPIPIPNPPAADAVFRIGADGLIIPDAEGVETPGGYTLIAGRPGLVPPALPERLLTPSTAPAEASDPALRLAAFRPRLRPEGLQETNERQQFGGLTRSELAAFRPKLRPESTQAVQQALAEAVEADEPETPPSAQAVAVSVRPTARPRNIDRIVATARASQPTTVAVAAPVTARAATPSGPTRASVARAATTPKAINLRRVNLIGVYGTSSNRSALVRLANGKFVKVRVGNRLDGGKVAAIGESQLRYVKGGRNITLDIPTG
ncbi:MAG: hypothetical protein AAFO93_03115 [Pseudomonadota bacterium]